MDGEGCREGRDRRIMGKVDGAVCRVKAYIRDRMGVCVVK